MKQLRTWYPRYSVGYYCSLFGRSRQAWYEQMKIKEDHHMADAVVLRIVKEIRQDLPRAGVPKLQILLQPRLKEHDIQLGRDALYRLLDRHGYLLRQRKKRVYTTDSNHHFRKYPNLIRQLPMLTAAGQLWVSDLTYLRINDRFGYLSIVTDAYSHKIIGYCLHPTLHSQGPIHALNMAARSKRSTSLIHHSDRGIQYCCAEYVQLLENIGIKISMTENGDPYENAIAERVNGILKGEFLLDQTFPSFTVAQQAVEKAVTAYNHIRPHASCDNLTPVQAHDQNGILRKHWKPKQRKEKQLLVDSIDSHHGHSAKSNTCIKEAGITQGAVKSEQELSQNRQPLSGISMQSVNPFQK